jgi:hypothetical protein
MCRRSVTPAAPPGRRGHSMIGLWRVRVSSAAFALALLALVVATLTAAGCSQDHRRSEAARSVGRTVASIRFVAASPLVRRQCDRTADRVGYPVPCPMLLPAGSAASPPVQDCGLPIIGPAGNPGCGQRWRGWVVGSSTNCCEHLVLQAAPRVIRNPARAIDGPGWWPGDRVEARGSVRVGAQVMRVFYVPPARNEGSAFAHHLVFVWDAEGHTYAYGFHVVDTSAATRAMDLELVRHLRTSRPRRCGHGHRGCPSGAG